MQQRKAFLTTRQLCRMWINGWHDYCLNLILQRNFTDVSQPENAKNCCVVQKIEEIQPLVFLQKGGTPQQWKSAAREFLNPKFPGRRIGGDAPNPRLPPSLILSFWIYFLELYEGQVHRSDTSTRSTLRHQTYRRVWGQKWNMTWCDERYIADNIEVRCPLTLYLNVQNLADRVILSSVIWFRNMFCNR
jgi:hypothetical protein